jgi:hypothetical protein
MCSRQSLEKLRKKKEELCRLDKAPVSLDDGWLTNPKGDPHQL